MDSWENKVGKRSPDDGRVWLYSDGVYRWSYRRDLYENRFEHNYVLKIMALVFGLKDTYENVGAEHSEYKTILRNAIIALVHKVYLDRSLAILQSRDDGE